MFLLSLDRTETGNDDKKREREREGQVVNFTIILRAAAFMQADPKSAKKIQ